MVLLTVRYFYVVQNQKGVAGAMIEAEAETSKSTTDLTLSLTLPISEIDRIPGCA
jgi:hypothetical protein